MRTTKRFDNAVVKLYTAFHNGELNAMDCKMCAVGNLCDNDNSWHPLNKDISRISKEQELFILQKTGYTALEIRQVETIFMFGHKISDDGSISGREKWADYRGTYLEKESQFKGLCAVVEYLCELDNIPNVMDYTKLFETENNQPKYQL